MPPSKLARFAATTRSALPASRNVCKPASASPSSTASVPGATAHVPDAGRRRSQTESRNKMVSPSGTVTAASNNAGTAPSEPTATDVLTASAASVRLSSDAITPPSTAKTGSGVRPERVTVPPPGPTQIAPLLVEKARSAAVSS